MAGNWCHKMRELKPAIQRTATYLVTEEMSMTLTSKISLPEGRPKKEVY
jgi:hypothetical protein